MKGLYAEVWAVEGAAGNGNTSITMVMVRKPLPPLGQKEPGLSKCS